jgi:hypothetical protein
LTIVGDAESILGLQPQKKKKGKIGPKLVTKTINYTCRARELHKRAKGFKIKLEILKKLAKFSIKLRKKEEEFILEIISKHFPINLLTEVFLVHCVPNGAIPPSWKHALGGTQ